MFSPLLCNRTLHNGARPDRNVTQHTNAIQLLAQQNDSEGISPDRLTVHNKPNKLNTVVSQSGLATDMQHANT